MKLNSNISIVALILIAASCNNTQSNIEKQAEKSNKQDSTTIVEKTELNPDTLINETTGTLVFNGVIDILPQNIQSITSTLGGKIVSTKILPGQYVNRGATIAIVENPAFIDLQQSYIDAHFQVEYLLAEYNRQKVLANEQATSQKKLQQSKAEYYSMKAKMDASSTQLRLLGINPEHIISSGIQQYIHISTPKSGYVEAVTINNGKYINPGEAFCEVIDKRNPLVKLSVYEKDLGKVNLNDILIFRVNGLGNITFYAKIISIGQKVDKQTRSVQVICSTKDNINKLRPGMYVSAQFAE